MQRILVNKWHERTFVVQGIQLKEEAAPESAHGEIGVALPYLGGRQLSAATRAVHKALRAAELAWWQATGGDSLRGSQPN